MISDWSQNVHKTIRYRSEVIKTADSAASGRNKKKGSRNKKNKKMMDLADLTGPYPIVSPGKKALSLNQTQKITNLLLKYGLKSTNQVIARVTLSSKDSLRFVREPKI